MFPLLFWSSRCNTRSCSTSQLYEGLSPSRHAVRCARGKASLAENPFVRRQFRAQLIRAFGFATHKADDTHFLSSSVPFTKACHNSHCWPIVRPRIIQRRPPISLTSASDNHHLDFPTGTSINLINYSTTTTSTRIFGLQSSHERLLHHYKAGSLFLLSGFD